MFDLGPWAGKKNGSPGDRTGRACEGDLNRDRSSAARSPGDVMNPIYRCLAGIDVHKKMLAVIVRREQDGKTE